MMLRLWRWLGSLCHPSGKRLIQIALDEEAYRRLRKLAVQMGMHPDNDLATLIRTMFWTSEAVIRAEEMGLEVGVMSTKVDPPKFEPVGFKAHRCTP